jgi:hypothetical protein
LTRENRAQVVDSSSALRARHSIYIGVQTIDLPSPARERLLHHLRIGRGRNIAGKLEVDARASCSNSVRRRLVSKTRTDRDVTRDQRRISPLDRRSPPDMNPPTGPISSSLTLPTKKAARSPAPALTLQNSTI